MRKSLLPLLALIAILGFGMLTGKASAVTERSAANSTVIHDEPMPRWELLTPTGHQDNYLTQCYQFRMAANSSGYEGGKTICYNHVNNGGMNQQMASVWCYDPIIGGGTTVYGFWVGQNVYSSARCPAYFPKAGWVDYYLR